MVLIWYQYWRVSSLPSRPEEDDMQSPIHTLDADTALAWPPARARRPRKTRSPARNPTNAEPGVVVAPARRPGRIRPAMGDALELALFIATLTASALLHLGALATIW